MDAIRVENIRKSFGRVQALDGVSLRVSPGEIFGLLGPDGAGKTTLFRILTTLLLPDSGTAAVYDCDIVADYRKIRMMSGYMPERFSLYPDLSVRENLHFYASLFGGRVEDNFDVIEPIYRQLAPFALRRAANLSGGMKQKLALCCALIHRPRVLFLDEPTTGVDAVSRSEFWDILGEITHVGMPVFVSTPYMDEASRCDRVALISSGRILESGRPEEITDRCALDVVAVISSDNYSMLGRLRAMDDFVGGAYLFGDCIHAYLRPGISSGILREKLPLAQVMEIKAGIEDVFINMIADEC